jgi:steroid delta-isomerase-like uncharacterized protein
MSERFFDDYLAGWNSPDGTRLASLIAEEWTYEDVAVGRVMRADEVVEFIARIRSWSADFVVELVSMQRDGNDYAIEWVWSGTHDGPAPGLGLPAATGRRYRVRGASVGRLDEAGKIAVHRDYWNLAGFLAQLGALPQLPTTSPGAH